jgi:hypothetical protein
LESARRRLRRYTAGLGRLRELGVELRAARGRLYSLSAVELNLSNEKGKSTGILLPACQFKIDKERQLEIENYQNPWKLQNILER